MTMIKKCFCCLVEKDMSVEVIYPYDDGNITQEASVSQLFAIECQGEEDPNDYRIVVMCHDCWHRLEVGRGIDMWIGQSCWKSLDPLIPFSRLPKPLSEDIWNAELYEPLP